MPLILSGLFDWHDLVSFEQVSTGETTSERHRSLQQELTSAKAQLEKRHEELAEVQKKAAAAKAAHQQEMVDLRSTLASLKQDKRALGG